MKDTENQPPISTQPPKRERLKLNMALIGFLLVLPTAGLVGLLARTAVPGAPFSGTPKNGVWADTDCMPSDQVGSPIGSLQQTLAHPDIIPTHHHPLLGQQAPDLDLADSEGKVWNLRELAHGRPVVLIFYYDYRCVSCVRQLFAIKRDLSLFQEVGARVVAVGGDPPELTRLQFQQYGPFGFLVLSDPGNEVAQTYGVFKKARDGKTADIRRHGTFVIDRDGAVRWVNVGDAPFRRNSALLYQLARIEGRFELLGGNLP